MENRNSPSPTAGGPDRMQRLGAADAASASRLVSAAASLILASSDEAGRPLASYAPFVVRDGALHVFVSQLAAHHPNLVRQRPVSVMIIEDEACTPQPFARRRLTLECALGIVHRDDYRYAPILDALQARFGAIVATLRGLADFELMALTPRAGAFVQGFGKAHRLGAEQAAQILQQASHLVKGGTG